MSALVYHPDISDDVNTIRNYQPIVFNDGRGDFDSSMQDDSLDMYSLSIDSIE